MASSFFIVSLFFILPAIAEENFVRRIPGKPLNKEKTKDPLDLVMDPPPSKTVPDRWRHYYEGHWYDPYNTNLLKGDLPLFGSQKNPWFLEIGLTSSTLIQSQDIPIPVGGVSTKNSGSLDTFGDGKIFLFNQNFQGLISLYQGNTSFKPQNFEMRFSPVFNTNYVQAGETGVLRIDPQRSSSREDHHWGIDEALVDLHIADISKRYDFISARLGIQPFNADFRGFIYQSSEPGVRVFGNADENRFQYNIAYFRRLEKDTNSGVNIIFDDREEDIWIGNLYRQDFPVPGHTIQGVVIHREDRAGDGEFRYNNNGFLVRPASIGDERSKNLSTTYFSINGDGHLGRINLIESLTYVLGSESHNSIAGREVDISAWQMALEGSYDFDWLRIRASGFWASGDSDPFDNQAEGFDGIVESPQFAGADQSYWFRQGIPFIGGGGVNLVNARSFLPNLRSGKEEGQSNFVNPGLRLFNLGMDMDLTPKLKSIFQTNFLWFDEVSSIKALRQIGSLPRSIGYDISQSLSYRPFLNNHMRLRLGGALFIPEEGFAQLFGDDLRYQTFGELVLQY